MNTIQFFGSLEMGLIYSLVALGVYISFRTLNFPDLSVDGTFPLGAAVAGSGILYGLSPLTATLLAMIAGAIAGYVTAFLATRLKMLNLLAGILTMTALYSINLRIMGKPNLALLGEKTLSTQLSELVTPVIHHVSVFLANVVLQLKILGVSVYNLFAGLLDASLMAEVAPLSDIVQGSFDHVNLLGLIIIVALVVLLFEWLLKTRIGLALRSIGSNPRMARSIGINDNAMVQTGLALANALVALAGALFAQVYGFADVSMGVGTIIIGLAAVIIGEAILPARNIAIALIACIIGAIIYRLAIAYALNTTELGLQATDLNLVTAIIVAVAMLVPTFKRSLKRGEKA